MTHSALDNAKLDALILYIVNRVENPADLGATKLHKILWFSDLAIFANYGKSIAGETYIKMPRGPWGEHVESSIDRLKASGMLAERREPHYNRTQRRFFATKNADISRFLPEEISVVDSMISAICSHHTATSISDFSHSDIWEMTLDRQSIPLETVFAMTTAEPDEEDYEWAKSAYTPDVATDVANLAARLS
ncbi:Panacea domain-containing protein [Azospirillum sp. INR13]|uniref:Panacea domain-containing protein n=1 Tax=Azospirillum sp. INR13 TaxID=2596919 RepID=UPI0018924275|nr:Panacea domain-containing protein [Azospirillum sp. INR13]